MAKKSAPKKKPAAKKASPKKELIASKDVLDPAKPEDALKDIEVVEEKVVPRKEGVIIGKETPSDSTKSDDKLIDAQARIDAYLRKANHDAVVQRRRGGPFTSARTGVIYVPVTIFK